MDLNRIVEDLKKEKGRLERAIAALEESASPRVAAKKLSVTAQQPAASNGKKRGAMTPAVIGDEKTLGRTQEEGFVEILSYSDRRRLGPLVCGF